MDVGKILRGDAGGGSDVVQGGTTSALREECRRKVKDGEVASDLVLLAECTVRVLEEPLSGEMLPKENLCVVVVVINILSVLIIVQVFKKIAENNEEVRNVLSNLRISMTDFAIKLPDVRIDRSSQNPAILKMKIWLRLTELLREIKTEENPAEIVDITVNLAHLPAIAQILKMEGLRKKINEMQEKLIANVYSDAEQPHKHKEIS